MSIAFLFAVCYNSPPTLVRVSSNNLANCATLVFSLEFSHNLVLNVFVTYNLRSFSNTDSFDKEHINSLIFVMSSF